MLQRQSRNKLRFFNSAYYAPVIKPTKNSLRMPPLQELPAFWQAYFAAADIAIAENFWGNLSILKRAYNHRDAYAMQLEQIGYQFQKDAEAPTPFYTTINWAMDQLHDLLESGQINEEELLIPAKAFSVTNEGVTTYLFIPFGHAVPDNAVELNLLPPDIFVKMLGQGYFPIGAPIRERTNQTLCEHDMAHIAGFISCPRYMKAVREAFRTVHQMMLTQPAIEKALANFDSLYSLRLYYMIEVFSLIPESNRQALEKLLDLKINDFSLDHPETIYPNVLAFLMKKEPAELNKYLYRVYEGFSVLVNPLGGESRDILNRTRKFSRGNQGGSFYSSMSNLDSKFDGSSIYSLLLNAKAALENKRSNHSDYVETIKSIHAPVIGALLGTSQLTVEDWVLQAIAETPDKNSKLFKYIVGTGLWNKSHVLYWAYGHPDCTKVLTKEDFTKDDLYFDDVNQEHTRNIRLV